MSYNKNKQVNKYMYEKVMGALHSTLLQLYIQNESERGI